MRKSGLKKGLIIFTGFCLVLIILWAVNNRIFKLTSVSNQSPSEYSIPRHIQYQYTLQNKTDHLVKNAELWTYAPVSQTATQRCARIESSHPYKLTQDILGNQALRFTFDEFPPYATRIITVKAELLLSNRANPLSKQNLQTFLVPEKYIEADAPAIYDLAQKLKARTPLKTAERIFQWVANNVQYVGYLPNDRGALYALTHQKGDCTEFMYLFAALCRANNIPARCIGGYICRENRILKPADYHNWAEFYHDGVWRISDPQNRVFKPDPSNYIAMRLIGKSQDNANFQFNKFRFQGAGLQAKMNS